MRTISIISSFLLAVGASARTPNHDPNMSRIAADAVRNIRFGGIGRGGSTGAAVSAAMKPPSVARNLMRGALLRIASDISGGTPLENIKTRVTITKLNMPNAVKELMEDGGVPQLWAGTPSRTIEGALIGAMFLVTSAFTKKQALALGASKTTASLAAGVAGGVAQAIVMTPAGLIFTSLNANRSRPGYENDNFLSVTNRIVREKGITGLFAGGQAMGMRQATNWASRAGFTEIARTGLGMSKFGMLGEIGSGVIGGLGSCWNTPIETVRVVMHKDVSAGIPAKSYGGYAQSIYEDGGVPALFRGVTPRGIQAIWQTVFLVVVPNMLGI